MPPDIGDWFNIALPKPVFNFPELACCKLPIPVIPIPDIRLPMEIQAQVATLNTAIRVAHKSIQEYIDKSFMFNIECPRL